MNDVSLEAIAVRAHEVARRVLRRFQGQLDAEDAADVASTVLLRIVRHVRDDPGSIVSVDDFAATLTYNAAYDFLRRKYPERTRHKNRLRYVLMHDDRLAMWTVEAGTLTGLAQWRGSSDAATRFDLSRDDATARMLDRHSAPDALVEIFGWISQPLTLVDLARLTAELWLVTELEIVDISAATNDARDATMQIEQRQYLDALWREIRELRAAQRTALMLNLRDSDGMNALALMILAGIATFDEIAAALAMEPARFAELWPLLPMNDLAIAEMLGVTRQQVINLRRSARERLGRRMNPKSVRWE